MSVTAIGETKPHLSVSQISMLAKCPKQWEYRYVYGIKSPPGVAATIGKGTHRSIELNLGEKMAWGQPLPMDAVKDAARDGLKAAWEREPPMWREGDPTQGQATDIAVALSALHATKLAPTLEPIALEQSFRIETPLAFDIEGVKDIVTPTHTRDTKTKGKKPPEDEIERSFQMAAYSLESQIAGQQKPVAMDYLVKTQVPQLITLPKEGGMMLTDDDHRRFLRRFEIATKVVTSGIFQPAEPLLSWWCTKKWCGYWDRCEFGARQAVSVGLVDPARLTSRIVPRRHTDTDTDDAATA